MVRITLLANPGSGTDTDPDALAAALRQRGAQPMTFTIDALSTAAADAADTGRLVVAGGDGSVGAAAHAAAQAGVPLAVVPTGTANDFARALGIPLDLEAALDLAAAPDPATTHAEVLLGDGRPFVNAASTGLAIVAARAAAPLKPRLGAAAYAVGGVRAGLTAHPLTLRVLADGVEAWAGDAWHVIAGGTGAFGGGSRLGRADHRDGMVDVAIVEAGPRVALVRRAWGMRAGTLEDQRGVVHVRGTRMELDVPAGTAFNVDGELWDREADAGPLHVDALPGGVTVLVP